MYANFGFGALVRLAGVPCEPLIRIKKRAKLSVSTAIRQLSRLAHRVGQQAAPGDALAGIMMSGKTIAAPRTGMPGTDEERERSTIEFFVTTITSARYELM